MCKPAGAAETAKQAKTRWSEDGDRFHIEWNAFSISIGVEFHSALSCVMEFDSNIEHPRVGPQGGVEVMPSQTAGVPGSRSVASAFLDRELFILAHQHRMVSSSKTRQPLPCALAETERPSTALSFRSESDRSYCHVTALAPRVFTSELCRLEQGAAAPAGHRLPLCAATTTLC